MTLLEAIAAFEGFGANPRNRPTRNNNPGNLSHGPFTSSRGGRLEAIPDGLQSTPRFAAFETVEAGWAALFDLLTTRYKGFTVEELILTYAPAFENDTAMYVRYICEKVGCEPTTVIDDLLASV
jgi:hypothetical protein